MTKSELATIRAMIADGLEDDLIIEEISDAQAAEHDDNDYRDAMPERISPDYWRNDAGEYRLG